MDHVRFHQLNTIDVSFYNLASIVPVWKDGTIDKYLDVGRNENMLFYLIHGERIYSINGQDFLKIRDGDIVFMPAKSLYLSRLRMDSPEDSSTGICIKFDIKDDKGNEIIIDEPPQWVAHDMDGHLYHSFSKLHKIIMQGTGEKLYSKVLLSQLMDVLITNVRKDKSFSSSSQSIYPAVLKIERSPQDQISVAELANLCYLSESTFRRKFQQYAGTSPANYRNAIRVRKAIELLESGIYTVEETAEAMGFTDQAHLSNMIKKQTGKTPKEFRKRSGSGHQNI